MPDENLEDEVKTDVEATDTSTEVAETSTDEETETPAPSSGEEKPAEGSEEEDAEPDGEEADKTDEPTDTETEAEEEPVKIEPKPVEGETPRERALRLEVERVKGLNRELRGKKLLGDVQPAASGQTELSEEDKKALEVFDPEQVGNMEKLLPVLAKKLGFVKKDELSKDTYQSSSQDVLDSWLADHPDYLPENDKGDILFNRLKEEITLYQKPASPRGWTKILNRAHNEIMGITTQPKVPVAQVQAANEKIKVASHGPASGGPKKGEQLRRTEATPDIKQAIASGALKGFTEEDFS